MIRKIWILAFVSIISLHLNAQLSGTYTIGKSGSENYSSFKAALIDCYLKGIVNTVTFKVSPGVYEEQVVVPYIFGAKVSTPVIFEAANGDSTSVILKYKPLSDSANFTLLIDATDYVVFRKMTFTTDTISGRLVEISTYCTGVQFYNCRFLGWKNGAELVYSAPYPAGYGNTYTIFMNNEFLNGSYAIRMNGNETTPDLYTYIQKNTFKGQSTGSVYLKNHFEPVISANYIHSYGNILPYTAINLESCSSKGKVLENKIIISKNKANAFGIRLFKSSGMYQNEFLIANNFISSITEAFTSAISIYNSTDIILAHNSTHLTGSTQGSVNLTLFSPRFLNIASNIFSNKAEGHCMEITNGQNLSIDYNAYFTNSNTYVHHDGIDYPSVAAWRDSIGFDNQSLQVDPGFCSDTLLFTFTPALDGAGTYFSQVSKDIELENRKNPPDIGADEFDPLVFNLTDSVEVCANESIELVAGNNWDTYCWQDTFFSKKYIFQPVDNQDKTLDVKAKVTRKGCAFTDTVHVVQHSYPVFDLGKDTSFCLQKFSGYDLHAPYGYPKYLWQDNSTDSIFTVTKPADSGLKVFHVKVTNTFGCENSDSVRIYFYDCSGMNEPFTPFQAWYSVNEKKIKFFWPEELTQKNASVSIYSVSGELLIESHVMEELDAGMLPSGIYLLKITDDKNVYFLKFFAE